MTIANKKAFTLIELVIAIALIGLWIAAILTLLREGLRFVDRTRQDVVSINLARQWIEAMYSMRNTNRRKRSWKKDQCWLLLDTFENYPSIDCENMNWMWSGMYLLSWSTINGQNYFSLTAWQDVLLDLSDWLQAWEDQYSLCKRDTWWVPCPGTVETTSEWRFYRQVVWKWVFRKDSSAVWWEQVSCVNGQDIDQFWALCWDEWPKEYRFCVRVASLKQWTNLVEQCAVMTNFE